MAMPTLEERVSAVEAGLEKMKQQVENSTPPSLPPQKVTGAVEEALAAIWRQTPDASWDTFPPDFGENMDTYLHGGGR